MELKGGGEEEALRALEEARRGLRGSSGGYEEDIEALRMVLGALVDFVKELGEPIERLVEAALRGLEGERLGRDVAGFYRSLREAGVPEETAVELTREYFRERVRAVSPVALLDQLLRRRGEGEGLVQRGARGEAEED